MMLVMETGRQDFTHAGALTEQHRKSTESREELLLALKSNAKSDRLLHALQSTGKLLKT